MAGAKNKKGAVPAKKSKKQIANAKKAAERKASEDLANATRAAEQRLAQIVNLRISGHSFAAIADSVGSTPGEIERMLNEDAQAYVRTQASLRMFVRNHVSAKQTELLAAVWDQATDKKDPEQLQAVDRADRILKNFARLHGAEAPAQSEVKVETSNEKVEELVQRLAQASGVGYNVNVFDLDDADIEEAEIVEDSADLVEQVQADSLAALEASSREVEEPQDGDTPLT